MARSDNAQHSIADIPVEDYTFVEALAGDVVGHGENATGIMYALQHDSSLWVGISFVLFLIVAYKLGKKAVLGGLDSKIQEIKDEIENAERIRVEAQELLAHYQRKQQDAEKEAEEMVKNAKEQSKAIKKTMKAEIDETMARREAQLSDRLKRLEENAIAQIQNKAADIAMSATSEMIMQALDEKTKKALTESSVSVISKQLN